MVNLTIGRKQRFAAQPKESKAVKAATTATTENERVRNRVKREERI